MKLPQKLWVIIVVLIVAILVTFPQVASADTYRRVFVTSTTYNGNLGGLAGADNKCQVRADAASLGGTWKAWLSDSTTSAKDRLTHSLIPYKLINGVTVDNDWTSLVASPYGLQNHISLTEYGVTFPIMVWTGTDGTGTKSTGGNFCNNYTGTSGDSLIGVSSASDYQWTAAGSQADCPGLKSLYCFEQTDFTPPVATPTPTPAPAVCTITSGSWGSINTTSGNNVALNVTTSGSCSGKQVAFDIQEETGALFGLFSTISGFFGASFAANNPAPAAISTSNSASASWVAEYDTIIGASNRYFFKVNIVGETAQVQSSDPKLTVSQPATVLSDSCGFDLAQGQTIRGNVEVNVSGSRTNPTYYLSLKLINSKIGDTLSAIKQANNLSSTFPSATLFNNGSITLECNVQSSLTGGVVYTNQITVNVAN